MRLQHARRFSRRRFLEGVTLISANLPLFPRVLRLLHAAFGRLSGRAQARCSSQVRTVDS